MTIEMTRSLVMDCDTAEHFYNWLDCHVAEDEQREVEQAIHALLRDQPELLNTHSWPEMRNMADYASAFCEKYGH